MRRKLTQLMVVVAAVATIAGVGYAAIPSANGTISACKRENGEIKLIER